MKPKRDILEEVGKTLSKERVEEAMSREVKLTKKELEEIKRIDEEIERTGIITVTEYH